VRRDLFELSWSQMTSDERWAVMGFLSRRVLGATVLIAGMISNQPAMAIGGAAIYLDAQLRLR
jgi:hypothetical protein